MDLSTRYLLACARLQALSNPKTWTQEDLLDVSGLINPPVSFERWKANMQGFEAVPAAPAVQPAPEGPGNAETAQTMDAILNGQMKGLFDAGVLSIQEVKSA